MSDYTHKYGIIDNENSKDVLHNLFVESNIDNELVDTDDALEIPKLDLDIKEIEAKTTNRATNIVSRLSDYYFDEKYIKEHPYIPNKIAQEVDNIRRLLKMLAVNEKAQDTLITSIVVSSTKGTLYGSLTSLQNSMLQMQTQLNSLINNLEDIFKEMQSNCEVTFQEKEKEEADDGTVTVRGSRDFIRQMTESINLNANDNQKSA